MAWKIKYLKSVQKSMQKLDKPAQKKIREFLEQRILKLEHPRQAGKQLTGEFSELWRYRIGDYRVVCEIRENELVILVVRVGHRKSVYR